MVFGIVVLVCIFLITFWVVSNYNSLVAFKNQFKNSYSQIDVQLQRRYDLIPNLVEAARAYMKHEVSTLEAVIKARNNAQQINLKVSSDPTNPNNMKQLVEAENVLSKSLGSFFALAENYPDLKASSTINQLMEELTSTENRVGFSRQAFNDSVMVYNTKIQQFPSNIIASLFNFTQADLLEITDQKAREAIKIKL